MILLNLCLILSSGIKSIHKRQAHRVHLETMRFTIFCIREKGILNSLPSVFNLAQGGSKETAASPADSVAPFLLRSPQPAFTVRSIEPFHAREKMPVSHNIA